MSLFAEPKEWYVRGEDGKVYGPASVASLIDWAKDGRIDPSGFLSRDRKSWFPSQLMPELEMTWLVETDPGKIFGPFNRELVKRMAASGELPKGANVYSRWPLPVDQDPEPTVVEKVVEKIVEKRVEVPVEKVVEKRVEVPVEKIVEKRIEVPVEKIKVVEKRVEVPIEKVKVVENRVEVPIEKVKIVEKRVEVPVEKIKVVEKRVEVPVEKVVEKRVEVPVEKIVEKIVKVEVPVEKIVEKVVEKIVEVPAKPSVVVPEVVDVVTDEPPPRRVASGIFKGADSNRLAALEEAARRELASARRRGIGSFFGGRK